MEHIVASNRTWHLNNNILYELQHGFRKKRSCETQLIQLTEDLGMQLKVEHQVDLVLLDFSNVFDKVNNLKLLSKLSTYGVRDKTLTCIGSFIGVEPRLVLEGQCPSDLPV